MSHQILTTKAIILKSSDFRESDKIFSFFTKDFGRVEAVAQGVRYLKSKLRYGLSGFSLLRVSFVETSRDFWRLIDVEEEVVLSEIRNDEEKSRLVLRIIALLDRLVPGSEKDLILWEKTKDYLFFLEKERSTPDIRSFEIWVAMDFLAHLGYLDRKKFLRNLTLEKIEHSRPHYEGLVRDVLEKSQL